jgi:hypothetical protein
MPAIHPTPKIPREVAAACAAIGKRTEDLLAWAVRDREVVLILNSGAKVRVKRPVDGPMAGRAA